MALTFKTEHRQTISLQQLLKNNSPTKLALSDLHPIYNLTSSIFLFIMTLPRSPMNSFRRKFLRSSGAKSAKDVSGSATTAGRQAAGDGGDGGEVGGTNEGSKDGGNSNTRENNVKSSRRINISRRSFSHRNQGGQSPGQSTKSPTATPAKSRSSPLLAKTPATIDTLQSPSQSVIRGENNTGISQREDSRTPLEATDINNASRPNKLSDTTKFETAKDVNLSPDNCKEVNPSQMSPEQYESLQSGFIQEINTLSSKLDEITRERDHYQKLSQELQKQNEDLKKVFGSLDDLNELRHQYERLFEDDYELGESGSGAKYIQYRNVGTVEEEDEERELPSPTNLFSNPSNGESISPISVKGTGESGEGRQKYNSNHGKSNVNLRTPQSMSSEIIVSPTAKSQSMEIDDMCNDLMEFMTDIKKKQQARREPVST